ncbi:MAG: peptidylprolyl isomerase [Oscillospiraceae bacterium]|nr:peptidylprolyl isomerase [Oscillospiraceae bacterium]
MSASSKKKLRNEQEAVKLTERQLAEQKEAKKVKAYTVAFAAVMVVIVAIFLVAAISNFVTASGIREKNTVAMTVGETEISNAELNYFFIDTVNTFYSQNGSYASLFGLDVTKPLDEQVFDTTTGDTWADYFLDSAKDSAHSVYAMAEAAEAAGHTLTEDEQASMESTLQYLSAYAGLYGYSDTESYLKAMYGNGASEKSYTAYVEKSILADSYYNAYQASLSFDDAALREAEAENYNGYSSYTYSYYYLAASRFLEGGTTSEDGTTVTYSDEEKAASIEAAEEAAKSLIDEKVTSIETFDLAIGALDVNEGTTAASTYCEDTLYSSVGSTIVDWVSDESRQAGDKTYIPSTSTSTNEDGEEVTAVTGYYVVLFESSNDNNFAMKNVRHILAEFEGGTTDEDGHTVYSDEEKAAAKAEAEALLEEWKSGDATEDSFAALANEKSDDGDGTTGGLYENIIPSSDYVENFLNWTLEATTPGETGIIETEYGYHVMYFVGDSELTYRDYMIENHLTADAMNTWYEEVLASVTATDGNTSYVTTGLILSNG